MTLPSPRKPPSGARFGAPPAILLQTQLQDGMPEVTSSQNHGADAPLTDDRRIIPEQRQFVRPARLERPAVFDHGWADGCDARVRNAHRATAQQVRHDREDGERLLPAFCVGRLWSSTWSQVVRPVVPLARRTAEAKTETGARRLQWRRIAKPPASTGSRRFR